MQKISDATIEKLKVLAKLELSEAEMQKTKEELNRVLLYMDKLNEVEIDGIEAFSYTPENSLEVEDIPKECTENAFREDVVTNSDGKDATLMNAPVQKSGQFVVPKTV